MGRHSSLVADRERILRWDSVEWEGLIILIQLDKDERIAGSEGLSTDVDSAVEGAVGRFGDRVSRVVVRLSNDHTGSGADFHSTMEAWVTGHQPISVTGDGETLPQAITGSARKLEQRVAETLESVGHTTVVETTAPPPVVVREIRLYSHSTLLYWWPVWLTGYIMAALTYWKGQPVVVGNAQELFHPSTSLGMTFIIVLFLVTVMTNFSVRGLASALTILTIAFTALLIAYLGLWDQILLWFGQLKVHLNFGAYFWFSTLLLIMWTATVLVIDHTSYWSVTPGQITYRTLFGAGSRSYNTQGMILEKHRDDLFRHWLLGLGSGDLQIKTAGASRDTIDVHNVLFIGYRVGAIQRMIAEIPEVNE